MVQKRSNVILGGMLWLKMQNRRVDTAIDLQDLGLSYIRQEEDGVHIGAMTSLRALETSSILNDLSRGAAAAAVQPIVGVQFRNCATVGGSLYGRFGFSDVLTLFLAWDAQVVLYGAGRMPLSQFVQIPRSRRDLLLEVIVPAQPVRAAYQSQRNSATDFPVLACCVMKKDDTCYVTKTVDQDNKGRKEVTYCVCVEDDPGQLESLSFRQLEALSAFLCDYVREEKSTIAFLRKAEPGVSASSYGIHVARLAGVPREVIRDAQTFQRKHFADYSFDTGQGDLFIDSQPAAEESIADEVLAELDAFNPETSTPLDALIFISDLKRKIGR